MTWKIVERRIGKAGNVKQRQQRQRQWDEQYDATWEIGYVVDGEFITQTAAFDRIYYPSYEQHFTNHPEDLAELIHTAKSLRNPHAIKTGGVDLQVPAILQYLEKHGLELKGKEIVDIGSYGHRSHKISVRLSPLTIKAFGQKKMTLEQFWQKKKCLAVWCDND